MCLTKAKMSKAPRNLVRKLEKIGQNNRAKGASFLRKAGKVIQKFPDNQIRIQTQ